MIVEAQFGEPRLQCAGSKGLMQRENNFMFEKETLQPLAVYVSVSDVLTRLGGDRSGSSEKIASSFIIA